jgi:plasmid segregation protein ParM
MAIVIAVDSGKYATKAVRRLSSGETKKIMFRTKMDSTNEVRTSDRKSCVALYEGNRYMIGESAETVDYEKSKAKDLHKICAYVAVGKLLNENEREVVLAIGCPLSIFSNVEERNKYREYFLGDGKVTISINEEEVEFTIKNVVVCPESSGIIFGNHKKYKDKMIGVIDIGGLNTNCAVYNRLNPIKSTMFTTNLGANILTNELKQTLNSTFPEANIQDWQMENIIADGFIKSHKEESALLIAKFFEGHMRNILDECKRKGWDLNNLDLVFVGGGSKLLEREIREFTSPETVISETAEWDNSEGFLVVGELNG